MPYTNERYEKEVPPETVVSHRGLTVYREYYAHDIRQPQHYYYATYPQNNYQEKSKSIFDVRDLPQSKGIALFDEKTHKAVIKKAISAGDLPYKEKIVPPPEKVPERVPPPKTTDAPKRRGRPKGSTNVRRK